MAAFLYTDPFNLASLRTVFTAELELAPLEVLLKLNVIFDLVFLEAWLDLYLYLNWLLLDISWIFFRFLKFLLVLD